jgi:hypothetical protein
MPPKQWSIGSSHRLTRGLPNIAAKMTAIPAGTEALCEIRDDVTEYFPIERIQLGRSRARQ